MLATIGAKSVDELFSDVPAVGAAAPRSVDLPDHLGELEVERAFQASAGEELSPPARRRSSSAPAPIATTCRRPSIT